MAVSIDMGELRAFALALEDSGRATEAEVEAVVERGALNIKNQLQEEMRGSGSFGAVARAISYDVSGSSAFGGGAVEAEIGPERGSPGSLANIAYFGTYKGGGTVPDPQGAVDAEEPKFIKALSDLIGKDL